MRALWLVLLALSVVLVAGCESFGAIWSAALWIPGLFLVLIIWIAAVIVKRVRGG
jgi:hypothetical protein